VFSWGLQYKLSLYQHVDGSNQIPAAKLLTDSNKASLQTAAVQAVETPAPFEFHLIFFSFTLLLLARFSMRLAQLQDWLQLGSLWKFCVLLSLHPFFFRPPPAYV
jgi:hypothetical protein